MNTEEDTLKSEIEKLEGQIKPLKDRLNEIYKQKRDDCAEKLKRVLKGEDKFSLDELRFAAYNRCVCGAGFAYPRNTPMLGEWECSAILLGIAIPAGQVGSVQHSATLPFVFYEIKSEDQASANGATTRPITE